MTELAETYLLLRPYRITTRELPQLRARIAAKCRRRARNIYHRDVEVRVTLEEGSLRAWVAVVGALFLGTYHELQSWHQFKLGAEEAYVDAKNFGSSAIEAIMDSAYADPSNIGFIRSERRTKAAGQLRKVIDELEALEQDYPSLSDEQLQVRLAAINGPCAASDP